MGRFPGKRWFMLIVLLQAVAGIAGGIGAAGYYYENRIIPGIEICHIPLEGLSSEDAREELLQNLTLPSSITFSWGNRLFPVPLHSGISSFNVEEAMEGARRMGELAGSGHYFFNMVRWAPLPVSLGVPLSISSSYLINELQGIKNELDREPENARIVIEEGIPFLMDEVPGWSLDLYQSKKIAEEYLLRGRFASIPLQVAEEQPAVKRADLPDVSRLIASCSTPLEDSIADRRHNIMLAAEAIDGRIIEPGEIFSFNEAVGPFTAEQGYREVIVIQNRKFVPGIGGGICQAATTLYQAALRGEMEIVQRSPHSRPVSYVPLGQDATVAEGLIDFKFCNSHSCPIILTAIMDDDVLSLFIYGAESEAVRSVEIVTEGIEVLAPRLLEQPDPSLPKGVRRPIQKGEEGYLVNVYRIIKGGDRETIKELITRDVYVPINEVVKVGTRDVARGKK